MPLGSTETSPSSSFTGDELSRLCVTVERVPLTSGSLCQHPLSHLWFTVWQIMCCF